MALRVTMIGGGMIAHDQILPSLYHLHRTGVIGPIQIVARRSKLLRELAEAPMLKAAFPAQSFDAYPALTEPPDKSHPDAYVKAIEKLPPRQLVVVATPETTHYEIIRFALEHDQHVLSVKPLVMNYRDAIEVEKLARSRGLFVGVEYHKRFDRRALEAKRRFKEGKFGSFRLGEAKLLEPWHYRHSNFQNWFTKENTDPFVYIGCHYVDQVYYITGLRPAEVSVKGVEGKFPNGNAAWMWSAGRVVFENGGVLSVINGLGYPDQAGGSNDQGIVMFFEGNGVDAGALIHHTDQYRGVQYCFADAASAGRPGSQSKPFHLINPDYFRLVPWMGEGLRPVGYGYESVEANVLAAVRLNAETSNLPPIHALGRAQEILREIDERGIIATPANSSINELVTEAGRLSIANGGRNVKINYGNSPGVEFAA